VPPLDVLAALSEGEARLLATVDGLGVDDQAVRQACALPGWTVGHLLTHVARNADSHVHRIDAARRGDEMVDQYPGGIPARNAAIERGSSRSAAEIVADLHDSTAWLEAAWPTVPDDVWDVRSRDGSGTVRALRELPSRRWQEVEVHRTDLAIPGAPTWRDWPDSWVRTRLPEMRASLPARLPTGAVAPTDADAREELAWLYGRFTRADWPALGPWG
jgi:maleylpyruvate isomerase